MSAGMLTVVNPRRRRSRKRRHTAKPATNRRRRRRVHAVANPSRRRSHRRVHARRRRHSNPRLGGNLVGTLMKGAGLAAGVIAANAATAAANNTFLKANPATGIAKIALKAGIGIVALPLLLKMVPGGKKFAGSVAIGAGIAVALDLWNQFGAGMLPAELHDYEVGTLSAYRPGQLDGWAPQGGMSGGPGVYDEQVYG